MEILIPGLILVGLMVWVSTRIKRSAAKAFEREEIETAEFSLIKPEGLLAPVDPAAGTLFSAFSRDFGTNGAEHMRCATAELTAVRNAQLSDVINEAMKDSITKLSEQIGVIDGNRCANIVVERLVQDIPLESHYKIIATRNQVYRLSVNVLTESKDEFQPKIDELLSSFSLS